MRKVMLAIILAPLVVLGATSPAEAAFSGNACGLLSARQVATVHVTPLKCTALKQINTPYTTNYSAQWGGTAALASHLFIGVILYKSATYLRVAKSNLHYSGPKKVSGIGSLAYESSSGGVLTDISFVVGHYIVSFNLRTSQPLKSLSAFNALAKAVAAKM